MSKNALIACFALLLALVAGFLFWHKPASLNEYRGEKISFRYPENYLKEPKTMLESTNLVSLVKVQASDPLAIIELYKEKGAILGANITKAPFLDYLDVAVDKNQSVTRHDYKKQSLKRIKISDKDASRLSFSYLYSDNKTRLYFNFFIIPAGNDAYYLLVSSVDQAKSKQDADRVQPTIELH